MAEILIKGMEMPKECYKNGMQYCLRFYSCPIVKKYLDIENDTSQEDIYHKRLDGCPLVELQPHGRLGDLDALGKLVFERKEKARDRGDWGVADGYMYAKELVDDAPTVIPASEEAD